jgi:ABC-type transporter Mla maintaining outer membrane lipid asymmetry ATPase subunit MlaF
MTQPKLLMLDEPSLGLAPFLVVEIFNIISRINKEENLTLIEEQRRGDDINEKLNFINILSLQSVCWWQFYF